MWKCLFGRNQSLVSSLNMCLLQGCTPLRGDQRLGAACSGSICHQPTNSLTSSVTEATFERGESLFWLCYPGITRNFNPIIASHSSSMGDGAGETPTVCALGSWPPHMSRWRVSLSPRTTGLWPAGGPSGGAVRWEAGLSSAQSQLWGSPAAAVVGNQLQHGWRDALETRASPVSPQKTAHQKGTSTHFITEAPEIPRRCAAAKQGAHWSKRCNN